MEVLRDRQRAEGCDGDRGDLEILGLAELAVDVARRIREFEDACGGKQLEENDPESEGRYPRRIVGWAIADHMRTELVVKALQMALWLRNPDAGAIMHSDRGTPPNTPLGCSAIVCARRAARIDVPGRLQCRQHDDGISTMQRELLDTREWDTGEQLASAMFESIEAWYNPHRRHSGIG